MLDNEDKLLRISQNKVLAKVMFQLLGHEPKREDAKRMTRAIDKDQPASYFYTLLWDDRIIGTVTLGDGGVIFVPKQ